MSYSVQHSEPHIVFAGGGTCGHLFPALAVVEHLSSAQISFAGSGKDRERECLRAAGFNDYVSLASSPLPKRPWQTWRFLSENAAGFVAARRFLQEQDISVVIGLGGYTSAPMVRAAIALNIPTVLLEQNLVPGRATRWLSTGARAVCVSFAQSAQFFKPTVHCEVTGNPVRSQFLPRGARVLQPHSMLEDPSIRQLVVCGGSGGSGLLNQQVPRALYKLGTRIEGWRILHQTGTGQVRATRELYHKLGLKAVVKPFIEDMASAISTADLVVSRAGGTTLAELSASGTPAVLIPWSGAADDHQTSNAQYYADSGASALVPESADEQRLDDRLTNVLHKLTTSETARLALSSRIQKLSHPDAAQVVARTISRLAHRKSFPLAA